MSNAAYEELQRDYQKLSEQYWNLKLSSEAELAALKEENRRLLDESQGRGLWAIAMTVLLALSLIAFGFLR